VKPKISMRESLADVDLFGRILAGASWFGWRVLLIAAAGEALTDDERVEFKRLTGRDREPGKMVRELICIFGRRGGKTLALAVFDCWIAALCDHRDVLAPGEIGIALIISRDSRAATVTLNYLEGILRDSIMLSQLVANRTAEAIELTNGIRIEVRPCNRVSVRGVTCVSVVAEELGHWFTAVDFANPDVEVLSAVRPTLLTTHGPLLIASSAYAKTGVLFDSFKKYYGAAGPPEILVAYGTSRDANPSLSHEEIERELERDPVRNRAEYLSEWRDDTEGFIPREVVEACVGDYVELPPQANLNYQCFIDTASGVEAGDSFAIVIAHRLDDRAVVDVIREARPPFDFFEVVNTMLLPLCKTYRIYKVVGDNYAGELAKEPIRRAGISYELSEKHKTELYVDPFLPMLNARKILLPRHDRTINQIASLERSLQRSGREQVTHPIHGHDDCANAIAGSVDLVYGNFGYDHSYYGWNEGDRDVPAPSPDRRPSAAQANLVNLYQSIGAALGPTKSTPNYWPPAPPDIRTPNAEWWKKR
jgi:hypothetical protein